MICEVSITQTVMFGWQYHQSSFRETMLNIDWYKLQHHHWNRYRCKSWQVLGDHLAIFVRFSSKIVNFVFFSSMMLIFAISSIFIRDEFVGSLGTSGTTGLHASAAVTVTSRWPSTNWWTFQTASCSTMCTLTSLTWGVLWLSSTPTSSGLVRRVTITGVLMLITSTRTHCDLLSWLFGSFVLWFCYTRCNFLRSASPSFMQFCTGVQQLFQYSELTFERSGSKFKVWTTVLKILKQ